MNRTTKSGRRGRGQAMAASKRFGRYKDEDSKAIREAGVENDQRLEAVFQAWSRFTRALKVVEPKEYYDNYNLASIMVEGLCSDERTVEAFCLALTSFDGEMAGYFLSALINASEGQDFVVHTQGHGSRLSWLGFQNTKNILILGDIGYSTGHMMESGSVTIEGDSENQLGSLCGGVLSISGYAGDEAGSEMSGGKLIIGGNAGMKVGDLMTGGEIHVTGEIGSIGDVKAGRIFHKGKLKLDR